MKQLRFRAQGAASLALWLSVSLAAILVLLSLPGSWGPAYGQTVPPCGRPSEPPPHGRRIKPPGPPAGPPPRCRFPVATTLVAAKGGSLTTADGAVRVVVPAGGAHDEVVAVLEPVMSSSAPPPPPEFQLGATIFHLEFRDPITGDPVPTAVEITVTLGDDDPEAGEDSGGLILAMFDGTAWMPLPSALDPTDQTITARTTIGAALFAVAVLAA
ncbi:MAG TPA: hypothetical protein VEQ11_04265 [Chloroflexota bacterium]|nr:hypothetical protein [Chloroflexota bacterium]